MAVVPGLETAPPPFLDVNGNRVVDPLDALLVINDLPSTSNAPLSGRAELAATVDDDELDAVSGLPTEITSKLAKKNPRDLAVELVLDEGVTPASIAAQATDGLLSSLSSHADFFSRARMGQASSTHRRPVLSVLILLPIGFVMIMRHRRSPA